MFEIQNIYINILVFFLEIISIISLLYRNKSLRSQLLWISLILFTNIFGVIIYWIITLKKRRKIFCFDLKKQKVINNGDNANFPNDILAVLKKYDIKGHSYYKQEFIYNNKIVYKKLYNQIKAAQESIYICSYIFSFDKYNTLLTRKLLDKAKAGVKVYIIVDAFGSNTLSSITNISRLFYLKYKRINLKVFSPLTRGLFLGNINHRNHRKMYIFDRKITYIGGANLSKDFLSSEKDVWQDSLIKFEGKLSGFYSRLFISDWNFISSKKIEQNYTIDNYNDCEEAQYAYPIPSGPDIVNLIILC